MLINSRKISMASSDRQKHRNALARARMANLRDIKEKKPEERTPEEQVSLQRYEESCRRKNERARKRLRERQERIDRILATLKTERSKVDQDFLEKVMLSRERKIHSDRDRRKVLNILGTSTIKEAENKGLPLPKISTKKEVTPNDFNANQRAAEYLSKVTASKKENRGDTETARARPSDFENSRMEAPVVAPFTNNAMYNAPFLPSYGAPGGNPSLYGPAPWAAMAYPPFGAHLIAQPPPLDPLPQGRSDEPSAIESV